MQPALLRRSWYEMPGRRETVGAHADPDRVPGMWGREDAERTRPERTRKKSCVTQSRQRRPRVMEIPTAVTWIRGEATGKGHERLCPEAAHAPRCHRSGVYAGADNVEHTIRLYARDLCALLHVHSTHLGKLRTVEWSRCL